MADKDAFIDFYSVLNVHPACEPKTLEAAYHRLAKTSHPDQTGVEDSTTFHAATQAYKLLRDPAARAEYDLLHAAFLHRDPTSPLDAEKALLTDAEAHDKILRYLYEKRRKTPGDAGALAFHLQEMLPCSYESFEFHQWYLKEKGFIVMSEQGTLAITVQGIDHVLSTAKVRSTEKLLLARFSQSAD